MRITLLFSSLVLLFILQLTATVFAQRCAATDNEPWSYDGRKNGPKKWKDTFEECGGKMQSPIDIHPDEAQTNDKEPITIVGYDQPLTASSFVNTGKTVEVTPRDDVERYIEMEGTRYNLQQFHFHWSDTATAGTEHGIDREFYFLEAHFVHKNDNDEIAVMAVLYQSSQPTNPAFDPIVQKLGGKLKYKDGRTGYNSEFDLNAFLPSDRAYFAYVGSLTTPPCTEGVNWIVFKDIQLIGEEQVRQFTDIYAVAKSEAKDGCQITRNVRGPQRLNDRIVYKFDSAM